MTFFQSALGFHDLPDIAACVDVKTALSEEITTV